jgi:hypothetical protein
LKFNPWPLLEREWKLQLGRKQAGRRGGYPGLLWALVAMSLPLLHQGLLSYGWDTAVENHAVPLQIAGCWLIGLTCLRACVGCAVSLAEETSHHSVQLVAHLPGSGGRLGLLASKVLVTCLPLLLEWVLFALLTVGMCWMGVLACPSELWRFFLAGLSAMGFFASLGLWLGASLSDLDRAANNARVVVVMTLVGWGMLESALKPPLPLIGALLWLALVFRSGARVSSAFRTGVLATVTALVLPGVLSASSFRLSQFSPLSAALDHQFTWDNCLLYGLGSLVVLALTLHQLRKQ